ncbi:Atu4866 domain-containing protein [Mesorhizobium sp. M0622]|uniref:Atu4866 domain-containing protein n=1 Tax=unclassified Mesorhizobium TaxID=325217 RepID=UPI00333630C0
MRPRLAAVLACVAIAAAPVGLALLLTPILAEEPMTHQDHPYVGMWITEDRHVRHELLPNGRYDEARGDRESAYRGRYQVEGNHIEYWDDTGFTADGEFVEGVLYHGGMILYRQR